jgi:hypothetical protein
MSDIVKGIIGGGWSLLVGWILPAALNVLVLAYVIRPLAPFVDPGHRFASAPATRQSVVVLVGAVVLGLLLAAAQTPLYRILEGYVGWRPSAVEATGWRRWTPAALLDRAQRRHLERKRLLAGRLDLLELGELSEDELSTKERERLAALRADPRFDRYREADAHRNASQRGLLWERLKRYPVDDAQVVPTRLGNAIRRLEEYGYDRFRLDSQRMWYELTATAPEAAGKQVDRARTTVDLLVCLLYGNLVMAATALGCALGYVADRPVRAGLLGLVAAALITLARGWYEMAVRNTDDWAAAVRALVNLGRHPLAEAMGLRIPDTFEAERDMWARLQSAIARPYDPELRAPLDKYRRPARPPAGPPDADRPQQRGPHGTQ